MVLLNRGYMGQNSTNGWMYFPVTKEGSSEQQAIAGQGKGTAKVGATLMSAAPTSAPTYMTTMLYVIQVIHFSKMFAVVPSHVACGKQLTPLLPCSPLSHNRESMVSRWSNR
jgi:hypothetical protein